MTCTSGAWRWRRWPGWGPDGLTSRASRPWRWRRSRRSSGAFRVAYPGVTIRLSDPRTPPSSSTFVRSGESEVGLVEHGRGRGPRHRCAPESGVLGRPPAREHGTSPFRVADLAALPLVATPPGSSTRRLLDDALARSAAAVTVVVEAAQREALLASHRGRGRRRVAAQTVGRDRRHPRLRRGRAPPQGVACRCPGAPRRAAHRSGTPVRRDRPGPGER